MKIWANIYYSLCLSLLSISALYGQGNAMAIGQWRSLLPQQKGSQLCLTDNHVVYANDWNLTFIDTEDLSPRFVSKVEGLSEMGIASVHYHAATQQVIVAYRNANLDFISHTGAIVNVNDIVRNTSISVARRILDIWTEDDEEIYIATSFGVIQLQPSGYVFGSTTITDIPVESVATFKNILFAGTSEGLYRIALDEGKNISDFGEWTFVAEDAGLPSLTNIADISRNEELLFIAAGSAIFTSRNGIDFELYQELPSDYDIVSLQSDQDQLLIASRQSGNDSHIWVVQDSLLQSLGSSCTDRINDIRQDAQGRIWIADEFRDIRYLSSSNRECQRLTYNSPYSDQISDIQYSDDQLYVASGGVTENFNYSFSREGFYILQADGQWNNINEFNTPFLQANDLLNFYTILNDPNTDQVYIGTYWNGLVEWNANSGEFQLYNQSNSSLQGTIGDEQRVRISGLAIDESQHLWMTTYGAPRPLNVKSPSGEWQSLSTGSARNLARLEQDQNGYLWSTIQGSPGGVLVYDYNQTPLITDDDNRRIIRMQNSELPSNRVHAIKTDLDGAVWVGTSAGVIIFDCGFSATESNCTGFRPLVLQDSIAALLLADQDVRSIEVDGANRKWFGTRNGIFVQSPDGTVQIHHFNEDNSPLFDNLVRDMAYDPKSGLMYIATNEGLQAYQTTTRIGENRHRDQNVLAYPNPVEPHYQGPIAIKGLVRDAQVKITDIDGKLVYETTALGGQAIWDGRHWGGNRVEAGVYLVWSANSDPFKASDGIVTKILVLR